ncbi:hypothetical protein EML15_09490 [Corynebacterium sp. sy017]|uniref:hypothetical protein n=1 Tax=unclassified Corynebacterium TaxID=2624378 RepID=UPI001186D41A|nr:MULTISPECIES: hypothetical protein [unclassified Corynebacterium]MBP3089371.1 hypothetical protein [Corynebacterium sp. sy017]TSD90935.1 hypothetical protein ELY17_09110 [Corynebacterium sp. SY003]
MLERIQSNIGLPAIFLYWGLGVMSYLLFHSLGVDLGTVVVLLGIPFIGVGLFVTVGWILGRKSSSSDD